MKRRTTARALLALIASGFVALPATAQQYRDPELYEDYQRQPYREPEPEGEPRAVSEAHFVADLGARFIGIEDTDGQSFAGQMTYYAPIGERLGFALGGDLGFGSVDGDFGEVVGLHTAAFWRNPRGGYVGAIVVFDHISEFQRVNTSAIGGAYLGRWDWMTTLGYDGGDGPGVGLFSFEAGYYPSRQFRVGGQLDTGTNETIGGAALLHWQPSEDSTVTIHADLGGGKLSDEGFYRIGFGVTFSFSERKTLVDQLRGDRLLSFE